MTPATYPPCLPLAARHSARAARLRHHAGQLPQLLPALWWACQGGGGSHAGVAIARSSCIAAGVHAWQPSPSALVAGERWPRSLAHSLPRMQAALSTPGPTPNCPTPCLCSGALAGAGHARQQQHEPRPAFGARWAGRLASACASTRVCMHARPHHAPCWAHGHGGGDDGRPAARPACLAWQMTGHIAGQPWQLLRRPGALRRRPPLAAASTPTPAPGCLSSPGVVLTIEPGLYIPDDPAFGRFAGIGVRIEDDVAVTGGRVGSRPRTPRDVPSPAL